MENHLYSVVRDGDSLTHFGILGQKWGLRRWQYSDGSLTPDGRVHYGVGPSRGIPKKEARQRIKDYNKVHGTRISPRKAIIKKGKYYYDGKGRRLYIDDLGIPNNSVTNPIHSSVKKSGKPNQQEQHKMRDVTTMTLEELREEKARLDAERQYMESYNNRYPKPAPKESKINSFNNEYIKPSLKRRGKELSDYIVGEAINKIAGRPIVNTTDMWYDEKAGVWKRGQRPGG